MKKQKTIKSSSSKVQNSNSSQAKYTSNSVVLVVETLVGSFIIFATAILLVILFSLQESAISQSSSYSYLTGINISKAVEYNKELLGSLRAVQNYTVTFALIIGLIALIKIMIIKNKKLRIVIGSTMLFFAIFTLLSAMYSEAIVKHFISIA